MKTKLGDLITIKHGYAFSGEFISSTCNNVVLVTPGNFRIGGGFQENRCKYFTSSYPSSYVLKPGDLIVTMTDLSKDGDTLGYGAIVPDSPTRIYLHNQRIGLISIIKDDICKDYVYWFLRTTKYHQQVLASSTGSTVKHTSPSRIQEIEIDLPPFDKQIAISNILNSIENKISNNLLINDNLAA